MLLQTILACLFWLVSTLSTEWERVIQLSLLVLSVSLITGSIMYIGGRVNTSTVSRIRLRFLWMVLDLLLILSRLCSIVPIRAISRRLHFRLTQIQISVLMRAIILSGQI